MKIYASFFEWHDKGRKELGVVEKLIEALNRSTALRLHSPKEFSPDPPDCVCLNASGQCIAIEVAEVVCENAVRLNAQGTEVYRSWNHGDLIAHIQHRLSEKDGKLFHGGPYQEVIACLFTDEPTLTASQATSELVGQLFGPFKQLTAAFLLFSYDPGSQTYPVVKLELLK